MVWFFLILAQAIPSIPLSTPNVVSGVRQQGLYVTAPVTVDGATVFRVATLANPGAPPIDTRVLLVQNAIAQILAIDPDRKTTAFDPRGFRVAISHEGSEYTLEARDDHHQTPLDIVTVTANDAHFADLSPADVAQEWQSALQPALTAALARRQPASIANSEQLVWKAAIALALLTLVALAVMWHFRERVFAAAWIGLVMLLAWLAATTWALLLFPTTAVLGHQMLRSMLTIAAIVAVAIVLDWFARIVVSQSSVLYLARSAHSDRARRQLRAPTVARAVSGFIRFLIVFVTALAVLGQLNVPIASVVTIGGIAALAIGFAAQSLVRDVMGGLLVLLEDQYVVGDYVMIGEHNGMVEHVTLRMVQVRDSSGRLITIPHSSVTQVVNASRGWARVDYRVAIDEGADVGKAIETLRSTLEGLQKEDAWRDAILIPVEWIGVEAIGKIGTVLRASVRSAPLRQFELRRHINQRVLERFAVAGIPLGIDPMGVFVPTPTQSNDPT